MSVAAHRTDHHATGDRSVLTITREFRAPIEDVWASVTESERLARWIGTFTGDPASGRVAFLMTAEGATEPEDMEIRECDPPRVLRVTSHVGEEQWHLDLVLEERDGVTTLTFAQPDIDPVAAESVGPGLGVLPRPARRRRDRAVTWRRSTSTATTTRRCRSTTASRPAEPLTRRDG